MMSLQVPALCARKRTDRNSIEMTKWECWKLAPPHDNLSEPQALALRGGGKEYDSKAAEKYDRVLWDMLAQVRISKMYRYGRMKGGMAQFVTLGMHVC